MLSLFAADGAAKAALLTKNMVTSNHVMYFIFFTLSPP